MEEQKICVFGDSIAWGADDPNGGWVNLLRLKCAQQEEYTEVYNLGISGDNSAGVLKRFESEAKTRMPTKLIFAIGINDTQYAIEEKVNRCSKEDFRKNIEKLIILAKKFTSQICFVGLTNVDEKRTNPVEWNHAKSYTNQYVEQYNTILKEICLGEKITFVPVFGLLKNSELTDGLHPNSEGHKKIFEEIKKKL